MIHLAQLNKTPAKIAGFVQFIVMAVTSLFMFSPLFAANGSGTIWETGVGAGSNFWTSLQNLYVNGLFLPLIGISLFGWAFFARNEKARGAFTTAIKIEIAVFIILQLPDVAIATFNQFASWLNGGQ